jgi:pyruvate dehydrogenase E2 component (dihydrolipoamide acetyltransferase)
VHHADRLRLDAIGAETVRLATAARSGTLSVDDVEGGTFAVTSLGMYGVDGFTPVINPPNAAILGVGRVRDDVAWTGDGVRRVRRLTLSLTWDHRVLDGAPAAEFCRSVKALLENPDALG